jgi:hypothetical protein
MERIGMLMAPCIGVFTRISTYRKWAPILLGSLVDMKKQSNPARGNDR